VGIIPVQSHPMMFGPRTSFPIADACFSAGSSNQRPVRLLIGAHCIVVTPPTPSRQATKPNPLQKQPRQQACVMVSDYLVYHFVVLIHLILGSILPGLCPLAK
jgi:hypothetical protein